MWSRKAAENPEGKRLSSRDNANRCCNVACIATRRQHKDLHQVTELSRRSESGKALSGRISERRCDERSDDEPTFEGLKECGGLNPFLRRSKAGACRLRTWDFQWLKSWPFQ